MCSTQLWASRLSGANTRQPSKTVGVVKILQTTAWQDYYTKLCLKFTQQRGSLSFQELQLLLFVRHAGSRQSLLQLGHRECCNLDQDFWKTSILNQTCIAQLKHRGGGGCIFPSVAVFLQGAQTRYKCLDLYNVGLMEFKGGTCSASWSASRAFSESTAPGETIGLCLQPYCTLILSPIQVFTSLPFKHLAPGVGASRLSL